MKLSNSTFFTTCVCKRSVFPLYCRTVVQWKKNIFILIKLKPRTFQLTSTHSAGEPVLQKFWPFTYSLTYHKTVLKSVWTWFTAWWSENYYEKKVHPKFFQNPFLGCPWVVCLGIRTWSSIGPYKEKNNFSFFHIKDK